MILRPFDPAAGDAVRLAGFACSTGQPFEDEVEAWVGTRAVLWLNDIPRTTFQRRALALVEEGDDLVAVVAWQDIVRVDMEGIWLEVLAVAASHQHAGLGQRTYDLVVGHLRTVERVAMSSPPSSIATTPGASASLPQRDGASCASRRPRAEGWIDLSTLHAQLPSASVLRIGLPSR